MAPSWWQLLIVVALAIILFGGRGKISSVMGDVAKGIKSFKTNIKDDESAAKIEQTEQPAASSTADTVGSNDTAAKS